MPLASFIASPSHTWSSSFPAAFYFLSIIVFSKEPGLLTTGLKQDSFDFVMFAPSDVSGFICAIACLLPFLAIQGICILPRLKIKKKIYSEMTLK